MFRRFFESRSFPIWMGLIASIGLVIGLLYDKNCGPRPPVVQPAPQVVVRVPVPAIEPEELVKQRAEFVLACIKEGQSKGPTPVWDYMVHTCEETSFSLYPRRTTVSRK